MEAVVRAEDPPIDVNRAAFAQVELSRLLNGYDICIDAPDIESEGLHHADVLMGNSSRRTSLSATAGKS